MASTVSLSFRWLDILEKEFDKSFVDLDLLLGDIDPDQSDLMYEGRHKMTSLSAAFAQLSHKAQTIFQSNAKLEVGCVGGRITTRFRENMKKLLRMCFANIYILIIGSTSGFKK